MTNKKFYLNKNKLTNQIIKIIQIIIIFTLLEKNFLKNNFIISIKEIIQQKFNEKLIKYFIRDFILL